MARPHKPGTYQHHRYHNTKTEVGDLILDYLRAHPRINSDNFIKLTALVAHMFGWDRGVYVGKKRKRTAADKMIQRIAQKTIRAKPKNINDIVLELERERKLSASKVGDSNEANEGRQTNDAGNAVRQETPEKGEGS